MADVVPAFCKWTTWFTRIDPVPDPAVEISVPGEGLALAFRVPHVLATSASTTPPGPHPQSEGRKATLYLHTASVSSSTRPISPCCWLSRAHTSGATVSTAVAGDHLGRSPANRVPDTHPASYHWHFRLGGMLFWHSGSPRLPGPHREVRPGDEALAASNLDWSVPNPRLYQEALLGWRSENCPSNGPQLRTWVEPSHRSCASRYNKGKMHRMPAGNAFTALMPTAVAGSPLLTSPFVEQSLVLSPSNILLIWHSIHYDVDMICFIEKVCMGS